MFQCFLTSHLTFIKQVKIIVYTVNDRLSALGTYLKTKAFVWHLFQTEYLIGPRRLLKSFLNKSVRQVNISQKSQNSLGLFSFGLN